MNKNIDIVQKTHTDYTKIEIRRAVYIRLRKQNYLGTAKCIRSL